MSDKSEDMTQPQDEAQELEQMARELHRKGETREACDAMERAVTLKPQDPQLHFGLAVLYDKLGMLRSAKREYDAVVDIDSNYVEAWRRLSHVALNTGDQMTAITASLHAVSIDPESADSWLTHGSVLSECEMWEEAEDALDRAVSLDPDSAWTWLNLGIMFDRSGRPSAAIEHIERALDTESDNHIILEISARIHCNDHRYHVAEDLCRQAIELGPGDGIAHMTLAQILSKMERNSEAIEELRRAVNIEPERAEFRFALGDMLFSQGHIEEAEVALAHAVRLNPEHTRAQDLLDQIQMRRAGGGSEMTVFVHDRAEQLTALVSQAGMIQNALLREFREIEGVEMTLDREVGTTDQTHYVVTGVSLTASGIGLEDLNGRLEEWMERNNVNGCGNVRLTVSDSEFTVMIMTLKGAEEVSG